MTCPHGYAPPHCTVTGCVSSRPAQRLADWTIADAHGPTRGKVDASKHDRAAVTLHHDVEALAARDTASGVISPGKVFVGVQENGKVAEGACDPFWRPPVHLHPRDDRPDELVMMNGKPRYQQGAPISCKGAVWGDERERRQRGRMIGDARDQRERLAGELAGVASAMSGKTTAEVATALGTTPQRAWRERK